MYSRVTASRLATETRGLVLVVLCLSTETMFLSLFLLPTLDHDVSLNRFMSNTSATVRFKNVLRYLEFVV